MTTKGRKRITRGVGAVVVLLLLGACGGCSDSEGDPDPNAPSPPSALRLEIIPPIIHAPPGSSFQLRAILVEDQGLVKEDPAQGVAWSGSVEFSSASDNPVTVTLSPGLSGPEVNDIRASQGSRTSSPAKIRLATQASPPVHEWVEVAHGTGEPPTAVVLEAEVDGACPGDRVLAVAGKARLNENHRPGCGDGAPAVGVFSTTAGALVERPVDLSGSPPWTPTLGDKLVRTSLPTLASRTLTVKPVDRVSNTDPSLTVKDDLALANALLGENRAGLRFELDPVVASSTGAKLDAPKNTCQDSQLLKSAFGADLTSPVLYVVYVDDIGGGAKGYACPASGRAGRVAFVSWADRDDTTLAHELGHVLGLNGDRLPWFGHTGTWQGTVKGFGPVNLMWAGQSLSGLGRSHLSLGQVFRMNADQGSWLVARKGLTATYDCQCEPYQDAPCPRLSLDFVDPSNPGSGSMCTP